MLGTATVRHDISGMAAAAQVPFGVRDLQALLADNPLFAEFSADQFKTLLGIVRGRQAGRSRRISPA